MIITCYWLWGVAGSRIVRGSSTLFADVVPHVLNIGGVTSTVMLPWMPPNSFVDKLSAIFFLFTSDTTCWLNLLTIHNKKYLNENFLFPQFWGSIRNVFKCLEPWAVLKRVILGRNFHYQEIIHKYYFWRDSPFWLFTSFL